MPTKETFTKKNPPHQKVENLRQWIEKNPHLARSSADSAANLRVEVFASFNHKEISKDLYNSLLKSGFLDRHPLFCVRVDPM